MQYALSIRFLLDRCLKGVIVLFTGLALLPLISVLSFVTRQGIHRLDIAAFTQLPPPPNVPQGGFGNALWGTIVMVGMGTIFSVPMGVLGALYLVEFGSQAPGTRAIRFASNILSSVPSILIGVFVYGIVVIPTTAFSQGRASFSALAGGIALAIVMLPIVVRTTEESLKQVSLETKWAALSVGATPSQAALGIIIPAALPGIITGILLAVARASGETAPLLFTALFNQYWARGLWDRTASLSVLIYEFSQTAFSNQKDLAWTAAMVLTCLIALISVMVRGVLGRSKP